MSIIEHSQFRVLLSTSPIDNPKEIKIKLLDSIINALGDKWERISESTRNMYEFVSFLGADRGFFWCSADYLSKKFNLSTRTVRGSLKQLCDADIMTVQHRRMGKWNLRGKPVYYFLSHPFNTSFHTEKVEKPCPVKPESIKSGSYHFSLQKDSKNILNKRYKGVPKRFVENFHSYFDDNSPLGSPGRLYGAFRQIAYKTNIEKENFTQGAVDALKATVNRMKKSKLNNPIAYFVGCAKIVCMDIFNHELEEMGANFSNFEGFQIPIME